MAYHKCASIYGTNNSAASVQIASGKIANFNTQLCIPFVSLKAYIEAVQEAGTPTPQSPKAISGVSAVNVYHTNKNLWTDKTSDYTKPSNYYISPILALKNGISYRISAKLKSGQSSVIGCVASIVKSGTSYEDFVGQSIVLTTSGTVNERTLAIDSTYTAPRIAFYIASGHTLQELFDIYEFQLEVGTNTTTYEPYNGNTTTIQLGQTVYGGYVEQDKEGHRRLVVTWGSVDLGSLTYIGYDYGGVQGWYALGISSLIEIPKANGNVICSIYKQPANDPAFNSDGVDYEIYIPTDNLLKIKNSDYSDATTFKNAMSGIYAYYELKTPITIDLPDGTPINTLSGVNNVYADSGDIEVAYRKIV